MNEMKGIERKISRSLSKDLSQHFSEGIWGKPIKAVMITGLVAEIKPGDLRNMK